MTRIKGREIGNQMLVYNIALFSHHPDPESITSAFVGTSRSKVLRPQWFGLEGAANGSGNTYNEITYGALLQAEILRLRFPNIRTVYLEASLLLRRPDRLIVEEDHRKYLPLLESALPLRDGPPGGAEFEGRRDGTEGRDDCETKALDSPATIPASPEFNLALKRRR